MPHYKLHYFNGRGRGELCRLIFAAAGVEYEDHRIEPQDWPKCKPSYFFGQLPVLEVDGVQINQSKAMAQYLAQEFGLAGKNHLEQAQCMALVLTLDDMGEGLSKIMHSQDKSEIPKQLKEYRESRLKPFVEKFEKYFEKHASHSGYIVGDKLTWADLAFADAWDHLSHPDLGAEELMAGAPALAKHRALVTSHPHIAAWIAKRPQTAF